jgi:hypothetical protein
MENMEQEQQMTVGELMNLIWTHYSDLKVSNPQWWEILMENLTSTENDQEALPTEDLKTLITFLMKIIKCWKMNSATWRVDSYEKLAERSSKLVGLTFRTSLPVIHPKKLIDLVESLLPQEDSIEEDSFASVSTKTTSMSSMTAPTQTIRVGANSQKGPRSKTTFDQLFEKEFRLAGSKSETGTTSSSISRQMGDDVNCLSCVEPFGDFRLELKIWRARDIEETPSSEWWKHVRDKAVLNYNKDSKLDTSVVKVFEEGLKHIRVQENRECCSQTKRFKKN